MLYTKDRSQYSTLQWNVTVSGIALELKRKRRQKLRAATSMFEDQTPHQHPHPHNFPLHQFKMYLYYHNYVLYNPAHWVPGYIFVFILCSLLFQLKIFPWKIPRPFPWGLDGDKMHLSLTNLKRCLILHGTFARTMCFFRCRVSFNACTHAVHATWILFWNIVRKIGRWAQDLRLIGKGVGVGMCGDFGSRTGIRTRYLSIDSESSVFTTYHITFSLSSHRPIISREQIM